MNFKLIFALFFFTHQAWSFDPDFKTVNDRVPLEFNYLFDSLKLSIKSPADKIRMVGLCQDLDANLGFLPKDQIFILMKSEVIKNVLEHKFQNVRQFDISTLLTARLEKELLERKKYLSSFSLWIWRSVIAELKHQEQLGLVTNKSFSVTSFEGEKKQQALRLRRYLNYLLPWIDQMDSLDATQFNELSKEVSWNILRRLNDRSLLFKRYSSTAAGDTKITIFNIPEKLTNLHPEDIKRANEEDSELPTLKEEGQKEKSEATNEVEKITPEDLSPLSEDITKELDKKISP